MTNTVLVTGGFGFLGRYVARRFKDAGYRVVGLGTGNWPPQAARAHGFDVWVSSSVQLSSLMQLQESFQVLVHCAGNGSVGYSFSHPLEDFRKTVQTSADLAEYARLSAPEAVLIYPSSAAVYGSKEDAPIRETDSRNPISPYGVHKMVTEDLLRSYSRTFGLRVAIIRFFSIYGPGLTKQLLWDASAKLASERAQPAVFWGTGEETRDWIYASDAAELILAVSRSDEKFVLLNGASGVRSTIRQTLQMLRSELGAAAGFTFNDRVREGDPRFYHADIGEARALGWRPAVSLAEGVGSYVRWLTTHRGCHP